MSLEKIADRIVDTDVLVMGGGIGGCPAAWKAAEHGLNVTLVEKANPERSGSAGTGLDEIGTFPHGISTLETLKRLGALVLGGRRVDPNVQYKVTDNMFWMLEEMEKMGVTMKYFDGQYRWLPGGGVAGEPEAPRLMLLTHWINVKPEMTAAVKKRHVNILERTMVVDLLTNKGRVVGATAINTRTGEFIIIKAKAVAIAAGYFQRHYNCETPFSWKYKMRYHFCPSAVAGDGHAVAYRAGADLVNMDFQEWGIHHRDHLTFS
jgi:succinate dehydrogenase/fumarate reductase flavoprotein subunit